MGRFEVKLELSGLALRYEGSEALYEEMLFDALSPVAAGRWKAAAVPAPAPSGPPAPPGPSPGALPAPGSAAAAPPAPAPVPGVDLLALYRRLASLGARSAERDAVLAALVFLGLGGKRDATPQDIVAHLQAHGFPTGDLKPKPILLKLAARTGHVVPGVLPGTYRATPQGQAFVQQRVVRG